MAGIAPLQYATEVDDIGFMIHTSFGNGHRLTGNPAGLTFLPDQRAPADPQRRQPDIRRAREWLQWEPKTDLDAGLRKTIEDFRTRL